MPEKKIDETGIVLEEVNCSLCGANNASPCIESCAIRQGGKKLYSLARCKNCDFVFLNPRPTKESILAYYRSTDREKSHNKLTLHEKFYYSFFRSIPGKRKGKLLDVGCGSGRYICLMREKGWDVEGIDIAYTDYGRDTLDLNICEGDLVSHDFQDNSFDVITLWWVLEHLYEPLEVIKKAYKLLKKGGVVVIAVPNIDSFEAKIFKQDWFHLFLPKHLSMYSPATLKNILKKGGFDWIKMRHDLFSFGFIGSLQCFLNRKGVQISLNNPLCYTLSLPIDIVFGLLKNSGLITAYAYKEETS